MALASSRGRVLVTGGDGFTGRHLVPELERRGYAVIAHSEADCDLRKADDVAAFIAATPLEYVIHLAGITFVPHGSPAEIYEVNAVGTANLLAALSDHQPRLRKAIVASSSQIYGSVDSAELDESVAAQPSSHYACSKLAMEHLAATFFDRLRIVIVRPFNYTGPGQPDHFLVPKIVAHYARGAASITLGNTEIVRDFSDVRMVVDVYCRLLEAPSDGVTFNVCSGIGRSLHWLLEEIGRLSGRQLRVNVASELMRANDARRMIGSNRRLVQQIGPLNYLDFSETLRWMLEEASASRRPAP